MVPNVRSWEPAVCEAPACSSSSWYRSWPPPAMPDPLSLCFHLPLVQTMRGPTAQQQSKPPVEFDQAISYVNKIKVRPPRAAPVMGSGWLGSRQPAALLVVRSAATVHCMVPAGCRLPMLVGRWLCCTLGPVAFAMLHYPIRRQVSRWLRQHSRLQHLALFPLLL